ncbi:monomethylamine:corrinoid methyltransferase [Candidatus Hecatella orcuttiae]|uniref:monomethylamine:corrinoid methyltransferase n=1 Tax=Candidatus Hecatella orcuttiae TaxID=1935119 RepID=UPI002867BC4C|nr:monomethylamine:corrinoid methyltransferase [Candidatus Hecatella orcuttiae]
MSVSFLEVLDRIHTGPVCKVKDWDTKVIPTKVTEKLKEHGLEGVCDPKNPVPADDSLADKFWEAGFEFAVEVGMLCTDTERNIRFTEEELKSALREARSQVALGTGLDKVVCKARKPEDGQAPTTFLGPFDTECSEELFVLAVQAAAQYRSVDIIHQPTLVTAYGRPLKGSTPYETVYGKLEAVLTKEGVRRAGRPGMSYPFLVSDVSGWGAIGAYGTVDAADPQVNLMWSLPPSCLKTNYPLLNKTAQALNFNGPVGAAHYSMIGGYSGSPEGCVVTANAAAVLILVVHQATIPSAAVFDLRHLFGGSSRESIWANSLTCQSQSRNTHNITLFNINPVAGPCTDMLLYEAAAQCIGHASSGTACIMGIRPRMGRYPHYFSGLEAGFAGEVGKASAGVKRSDANEIVKTLVARYEDKLKEPPAGKKFEECVDLKTLKPIPEWLAIYRKVKKELVDHGIPLE